MVEKEERIDMGKENILKTIKRLFLVFFILFFIFILIIIFYKPKTTLHLTGGNQSVNAEIYIDDEKVGILKPHYNPNLKKYFGIADIKVEKGKHKLTIINKNNKKLEIEYETMGENFINIDFENMNIKY